MMVYSTRYLGSHPSTITLTDVHQAENLIRRYILDLHIGLPLQYNL